MLAIFIFKSSKYETGLSMKILHGDVTRAFHSTKNSGLHYQEFLVANYKAITRMFGKEPDNLERYSKIFRKFLPRTALPTQLVVQLGQQCQLQIYTTLYKPTCITGQAFQFSIECPKTKTKPITCTSCTIIDYLANLKQQ